MANRNRSANRRAPASSRTAGTDTTPALSLVKNETPQADVDTAFAEIAASVDSETTEPTAEVTPESETPEVTEPSEPSGDEPTGEPEVSEPATAKAEKSPKRETFADCPACKYHFPRPQAMRDSTKKSACMSAKACDKRVAANLEASKAAAAAKRAATRAAKAEAAAAS